MATSNIRDQGPTPSEAEEPSTATLLEATSVNCQLLAEKLRKQDIQGNKVAIHSYLGNNLPTSLQDEKSKYYALYADYIRLKSDKQKVEDFNKRLLTYNAQKDQYTDKLMQEIKVLKPLTTSSHNETSTNAESNGRSPISRDEYSKLYEELQTTIRENTSLKKQVDKAKMEFREETEVLKMQVRAHRDDWEAERREKVEVENRELQLQEKMHRMERKLKELQQQLLENESCKCMCHHSSNGSQSEPIIRNHLSSMNSNAYYGSSARLIPRSSYNNLSNFELVSDGTPEEKIEKSKSSLPPSLKSAASLTKNGLTSVTPSVNGTKNTDIHCPDCGKVFPKHVHLHFLEHFEKCHRRAIL